MIGTSVVLARSLKSVECQLRKIAHFIHGKASERDQLTAASASIVTNPQSSVPGRIASTPPLGANLLALNNLRRGAGFGGPELETLDREHVLDRLLPMVERKIKEAPVDGHEQFVAAQSAKAANGSFGAHVYVGPEGI